MEDSAGIAWFPYQKGFQGHFPDIAMNPDGWVVEMHQSQARMVLFSRMGKVLDDDSRIDWRTDKEVEDGHQVSIAMNAKLQIVQIHTSPNKLALWCRAGWLNVKDPSRPAIEWGTSVGIGPGQQGSIAIDDAGNVVEMHVSQGAMTLWYRVGTFDTASLSVRWKTENFMGAGPGHEPSIALKDGKVIEMHESEGTTVTWYRVGPLNGDRIDFGNAAPWGEGRMPEVGFTTADQVVVLNNANGNTVSKRGSVDWGRKEVAWVEGTTEKQGFDQLAIDGAPSGRIVSMYADDMQLYDRTGKVT